MHWILQDNLFNEKAYQVLLDTLRRMDIPHSIHKVVPFVGDLLPEPDFATKNVMCMGSYSLRHYAKKKGWYPGVFDLEPFDFTEQLQHWKQHMLNADAVVSTFKDCKFTDTEMFIRPIHDSKVFAGKIMDKTKFEDWQHRVVQLKLDCGDSLTADTLVQVCTLKQIFSEHRFWIVKGRIITSSTYKIGSKVVYKPLIDDRYGEYVINRLTEWRPLEAFVIDVADTPEGIKVIEINTLNSCGFYSADLQKLIVSLEDNFDEEAQALLAVEKEISQENERISKGWY